MELLPLLCLCLLTRSGVTSAQLNGPTVITVEGGTDAVLPCSLSTKENIEFKLFDWKKVAQKDEGLKEVFLYNGGIHYNNGFDGQSEEFKGRVSHFQGELEHGNASIIIRNTKISDSGEYTCEFPNLEPPQKFYIELVVGKGPEKTSGPTVITVKGGTDAVLPCSLSTKENIEFKLLQWRKVPWNNDGRKEVFLYNGGQHDNNGFDGQSKEFKERVSHFQGELEHGNASIIIRNTKISDSGEYTCEFPNLEPPQKFYIELVVVDHILKDRSELNIPGFAPKPSITSLKETKVWSLLQCEVHGNPKPEVEWQDSAGNKLPAEESQVTEKRGLFYITLNSTVTKRGRYRCNATQKTISHQVYAETDVYISGSPTGWTVGLVLLALVAHLALLALLALAVLAYKRYIILNCNKGPANVQDLHPNIPLLSGPANVPDPQTNIKDNPVTVQMQPQEKQSCGPGMVQMQPQEKPSCDPENQSSSTHTYEIPNHVRGQKQNPSCDEEYEDVQNPSKSHGSTPEPNALHPFMMEERL